MKKHGIMKVIIGVVLVMSLMFGEAATVFAAQGDNHVHEWGSNEYVEQVIVPNYSYQYLYTYESGGHTFDVYRVTEWCLFYRQCYCGARGCYREGGITYDINILQ